MLTWDAGPNGYAGLLRWWGEGRGGSQKLKELLLVGTWPADAEVQHHAHREILAACLATESAAQVDLRSSVFSFATTQRQRLQPCAEGAFSHQ